MLSILVLQFIVYGVRSPDNTSFTESKKILVNRPANSPKPKVILYGAQRIGLCDDFVISGELSQGWCSQFDSIILFCFFNIFFDL